ncbi:MAG: hypothetical protein WBP61_19385 [Nocardioides sp.]
MFDESRGRRRTAAFASSALVAGALTVLPGIAGLSAATAAPVDLGYTCQTSGSFAETLDSTLQIETTVPESVLPGEDFVADVTYTLDMGDASMGPVDSVSGEIDFEFTVGGVASSVSVPTVTWTPAVEGLVFSGSGEVTLTAPAEPGSAGIEVGAVALDGRAHVPFGPPGGVTQDFDVPCVADAEQDQSVGAIEVEEPEPSLAYTCVIDGPSPVDVPTTVKVDVTAPETATAGQPFAADVAVEADMGTTYLGPVSALAGELDLDMLVGDAASAVSVPIEPVSLTPSAPNHVVIVGEGEVELTAPAAAGPADIDLGDIVGDFQATVFGTSMQTTIPCTADADQDQTVASTTVEEALVTTITDATVTGTAKVGKLLTASATVDPDDATVAYQWLRAGNVINGATDASYTAVAADANKKLSVRLVASKPGYTDAEATAAAGKVAPGTLTVKGKATIKGKAKVGKTLTAVPATAKGAKISYQWLANGKAIKKADGKKIKLKNGLAGKKVKVKVTYNETGYSKVVQTSKAVKVKKK